MMIPFSFFIPHGNYVSCFLISVNFFCKVNGISLLGENHKDVVNILKELPVKVTMVCCREAAPSASQSVMDECQMPEQVIQYKDMCTICLGCCECVI